MAWNESGGTPGGKKNPWGNNRPGKGPPDLDEVLRNLQRKLTAFMGGGSGRGGVSGGGGGAAAAGFGAASLVVILLAIWGFTGLYQVDASRGPLNPGRSSMCLRSKGSANRREC
jgi:modulator of FtsH protease HflK